MEESFIKNIFLDTIEKLKYFIKGNIDFEIDYKELDNLINKVRIALGNEEYYKDEKFKKIFGKFLEGIDPNIFEKKRKQNYITSQIIDDMKLRRSKDYEKIKEIRRSLI